MQIKITSTVLLIVTVLFLISCPVNSGPSSYTLSGTMSRADATNMTTHIKIMTKGGDINDNALYSTSIVLSNGSNPYYNSYSISGIAPGEYTVWAFIESIDTNGQYDTNEPMKSTVINFDGNKTWSVSTTWD